MQLLGHYNNKPEAFIFDLDGVITETQELHMKAWERMFNEFLEERRKLAPSQDEQLQNFNLPSDYLEYLDGKPREEGIKSFLASRRIFSQDDLVTELGKRKNHYYLELLKQEGPHVISDTVSFIHKLNDAGVPMAVVSSSKNCREILDMTRLTPFFKAIVTPNEANPKGLKGKPSPDYFLEASRSLKKEPASCAIVEDSLAGVEAGRKGHFGAVIGFDHHGNEETLKSLRKRGADHTVSSLWELGEMKEVLALPNALESFGKLCSSPERVKEMFLFLDYDGTLSPIVDDPQKALPLPGIEELIVEIKKHIPVCIITGRDTPVIREKIRVTDIYFVACHGFEITGPENYLYQLQEAKELIPALSRAQEQLERELGEIAGLVVERKSFGVAFHYRKVKSKRDQDKIIGRVAAYSRNVSLKAKAGEMVIELLPDLDWNKGKALLKMYEVLKLGRERAPLYLGDGLTDEDAFLEIEHWGHSILASEEIRPTLAHYHLKGPVEVKQFLERLLQVLTGEKHV